MARRLPGGYGKRTGEDERVNRSESEFAREKLQAAENGWIIANFVPGTHLDVTGVLMVTGVFSLYLVPEVRTQSAAVSTARIGCAGASASSIVQTALYAYQDGSFRRIPGTLGIFTTGSAGLKSATLAGQALIAPDTRLFIGVAVSGAPVLEGFQAGTTVTGRLLASFTYASSTCPASVEKAALTKSYTTDVPAVVYLSKIAADVL